MLKLIRYVLYASVKLTLSRGKYQMEKKNTFALGDRLELDISSNGIKEYLLQNYLTLSLYYYFLFHWRRLHKSRIKK